MVDFNTVTEFENKVASFFGAPYGVAVDSCTHGLELCLRYTKATAIQVPKHTYVSVPMLANKLRLKLYWGIYDWVNCYGITYNIIDAAVLWKKDSYIPGTFMCLSFQYQKHLNLGRGGMILTDNESSAHFLKKTSYDGRLPNIPWRDQDIATFGFHYYMTPEIAKLGLEKLQKAIDTPPRQWTTSDWPDVSKFKVFNQ